MAKTKNIQAIPLTVPELMSEFAANSILAAKKYNHNMLNVTGRITEIDEISGVYCIMLDNYLVCTIARADREKVMTCTVGQVKTLEGIFEDELLKSSSIENLNYEKSAAYHMSTLHIN